MASNVIASMDAKVSALATTIGTAVKEVKATHATDKAALGAADTALSNRLDVVEPVLVASDFTGETNTVKKYVDAAAKTEADARTALSDSILGDSGAIANLRSDLESKINASATSAYKYKGSVATKDELPKDASNGDVYNVGTGSDAMNYAWVAGSGDTAGFWDSLGQVFDFDATLTDYSTTFTTAMNA